MMIPTEWLWKRICKVSLTLDVINVNKNDSLFGLSFSFGTPSGARTTWGGVRMLENRRFDALPALTYPRYYPKITILPCLHN